MVKAESTVRFRYVQTQKRVDLLSNYLDSDTIIAMSKKVYEPIYGDIKVGQFAMSLIQEIDHETIPLFRHWADPTNEDFGTFNPVRIVTPLLESASQIEFSENPKEFLKLLKVPEPKISWFMFRHGLSHSIRPYQVEYKNKKYGWGIKQYKGVHHVSTDNIIMLSVLQLIEDLKSYLEKHKYDDKVIKIQTGVKLLE